MSVEKQNIPVILDLGFATVEHVPGPDDDVISPDLPVKTVEPDENQTEFLFETGIRDGV